MKVLFITNMWPDAERPWYGTFIHSQAESLEALGIEVETVAIRGYASRSRYVSATARVLRLNATGRYDLVHAHYGHSGIVGRAQFRAPLVLSYCGDDVLGTPKASGSLARRGQIEAVVFRRMAHLCAATITKSRQMEAMLPRSCRCRNTVIPNGVDMARFAAIPRDDARGRLGWPRDEPVVLFAGDPSIPRKNFALARAAASRLPRVTLRVASGVAPGEMPVWMSAADVLLVTSRWEGSPNVVKEAMACELPVVSTDVGDARERLDGISGCRVCTGDPLALADGVAAALEHGRSAHAREAVSVVRLEAVASRVVSVYESVVGRR